MEEHYPDETTNYVPENNIPPLIDRIRDYWFELEELDGAVPYELYACCAELLGKNGVATGEPIIVQQSRISDDKWRMRLWGAWALRAMQDEEAMMPHC